MDLFAIAFAALLGSNIILSRFLGICPFLGVSKKTSSIDRGRGGKVISIELKWL